MIKEETVIKKLTEKDFLRNTWSGGVTRELFIYPEYSSYKNRDFNFRVSMATTDIPESTFTSLPNVHRYISILEGEIEIFHKGKESVKLRPNEIHYFEGGWDTTAKGKVLDFNLMLKDCSGTLEYKDLNGKIEIENPSMAFVFCAKGEIKIKDMTLEQYELVVAEEENIVVEGKNAGIYIGKIFDIK